MDKHDLIRSTTSAKLDGKTIAGVAIPYNSEADLGDGLFEVIRPGCLGQFLRSNPKVCAIKEHDANMLLGNTLDGSLKLIDTTDALRFTVEPPDGVSYADDLKRAMAANPNAYGASFHMRLDPKGYKWIKRSDGSYLREITQIALMREITVTAFPVYEDTAAYLRSIRETQDETAGEAEAMLAYLSIRSKAT